MSIVVSQNNYLVVNENDPQEKCIGVVQSFDVAIFGNLPIVTSKVAFFKNRIVDVSTIPDEILSNLFIRATPLAGMQLYLVSEWLDPITGLPRTSDTRKFKVTMPCQPLPRDITDDIMVFESLTFYEWETVDRANPN